MRSWLSIACAPKKKQIRATIIFPDNHKLQKTCKNMQENLKKNKTVRSGFRVQFISASSHSALPCSIFPYRPLFLSLRPLLSPGLCSFYAGHMQSGCSLGTCGGSKRRDLLTLVRGEVGGSGTCLGFRLRPSPSARPLSSATVRRSVSCASCAYNSSKRGCQTHAYHRLRLFG